MSTGASENDRRSPDTEFIRIGGSGKIAFVEYDVSKECENVYLKGRKFDNLEDALAYEKIWRKLPLDEESAKYFMRSFQEDIVMNSLLMPCFSNDDFGDMIEELFLVFLEKLYDQRKDRRRSCLKES